MADKHEVVFREGTNGTFGRASDADGDASSTPGLVGGGATYSTWALKPRRFITEEEWDAMGSSSQ